MIYQKNYKIYFYSHIFHYAEIMLHMCACLLKNSYYRNSTLTSMSVQPVLGVLGAAADKVKDEQGAKDHGADRYSYIERCEVTHSRN